MYDKLENFQNTWRKLVHECDDDKTTSIDTQPIVLTCMFYRMLRLIRQIQNDNIKLSRSLGQHSSRTIPKLKYKMNRHVFYRFY